MRNFLSGNGQDTSHKVKKGIDIIENGIDPFCMYVYPFSDFLTEHTRFHCMKMKRYACFSAMAK